MENLPPVARFPDNNGVSSCEGTEFNFIKRYSQLSIPGYVRQRLLNWQNCDTLSWEWMNLLMVSKLDKTTDGKKCQSWHFDNLALFLQFNNLWHFQRILKDTWLWLDNCIASFTPTFTFQKIESLSGCRAEEVFMRESQEWAIALWNFWILFLAYW